MWVAVSDGGEHGQRAVVEGALPERGMKGGRKDSCRAELVHAFEVVNLRDGGRRADADDGDFQTFSAQHGGEVAHQVALVPRQVEQFRVRARVVRMARVGEDAGKAKARRIKYETGNRSRLGELRLDAAAVVAAINFEEHVEGHAAAPRRFAERAGNRSVVRDERETLARARHFDGGSELAGLDGDGVGDVVEALRGKVAGFGECRDGDAAPLARGLEPRHFDALVSLDVRAQVRAHALHALRHASSVTPHASDIKHQRGGL